MILINLLTPNGLTPGGGSTAHIYTQTILRTQLTTLLGRRTTLFGMTSCITFPRHHIIFGSSYQADGMGGASGTHGEE